jgi:PAS domain S-box-containing protein
MKKYNLLIPTPVGNSMKIGNRIYALVGFFLVLLALVSSIGIWQLHRISAEIEGIMQHNIPLTENLTEITIHQLEQTIYFERTFHASEVMKEHHSVRIDFGKSVGKYIELTIKIEREFEAVKVTAQRALDAAISDVERQNYQRIITMLEKLVTEHKDYTKLANQAFDLIDADKLGKALTLLPRIETEEDNLDRQLKKMLAHVASINGRAINLLNDDKPFALNLLIILTSIALVIGIGAAILMVRKRISRPLSEIVTGLDALSSGDMSVDVKVYNDDEIGAVARSYEAFKHSQIKIHQREQELEASQQRFKDIVEISSDWIWECNKDLRFIYLSNRFSQVAGVPKERLLGRTLHEFSENAISDPDAYLADVEARRSFRDFHKSVEDDSGDIRHWKTSGRPVFDADGEFKGYRGTGSDCTAQFRDQAELVRHRDHLQELVDTATQELKVQAVELRDALAKEKNLSKLQREFVSMASHEFRTPLAIIDATAQRMKSRASKNQLTPEDALQRVGKIRDAVRRMTRLMESTLTGARMQEGKIEFSIEPCNIGNIIQEVCARQQEFARSHIITCELTDLPDIIQADLGSLDQIFTNLLSNAVKYAPNAPDIHVLVRSEGNHVTIQVRDHGIGIDAEDVSRIGERFFRANSATGMAGTGIGLNLVKTLVEMHGGTISIESQLDEGSTFTIRLPVDGPSQTEHAA